MAGMAERTKNVEHGLQPAKFGHWKSLISTERRNEQKYGTRTAAC